MPEQPEPPPATPAAPAPAPPGAVPPELADRLGPRLLGIDHLGVAAPDLQEALDRWAGLGLVERHREENQDQGVVEVMLTAGPAAGATRLQLLAPLTPASPIARFLHRRGPGLHHLALAVDDLDAVCAELTRAGLALIYPVGRRGTASSRINFLHPQAVGGALVELVEPVSFRSDQPGSDDAIG